MEYCTIQCLVSIVTFSIIFSYLGWKLGYDKENQSKWEYVFVLVISQLAIACLFSWNNKNLSPIQGNFLFCISFWITSVAEFTLNLLHSYLYKKCSPTSNKKCSPNEDTSNWKAKLKAKLRVGGGLFAAVLVLAWCLVWLVQFSGYGAISLSGEVIIIAAMGGYVGSQFNWIKFK